MDWLHWLLVAVVGALLAYLYGESRARATESRLRQEMKQKLKSKNSTPPFPPIVPTSASSSASAADEEKEEGSLCSSSSSPVRQRQSKAVAFSAALPPRSKSSLAAIIVPPSSSSASSRPLHPSSLTDLIATTAVNNNNNERSLASEKKRPHSTSSLLKTHSSDASTAALAKREGEQKKKKNTNKKKESQRTSAETQAQTVRRQSQRSFTEREVAHNLEELRQRFLDANLGVPLKLRKYSKMQCYCRSFLGREAVDWLLDNVELEPAHSSPTLAPSNSSDNGSSNYDRKTDPLARQKAVDLGVRLWASGLFRHATHGSRRPFTDGDVLFQFTKEGKKKMKKLTKLENNYIENFNNANKQQSKSNKQKSSMKLTKKSSIGKKSSRFLLRSGSKNSSLSSSGELSTMRESKKDGEEEEEIVTTEAVETEESSNLEQHLKRREGWVDVQMKEEQWVKHWCVLREIDPVQQQQQQQQDQFAEQKKSDADAVKNDGGDQRGGERVGGDLSQAQKKPGWELAVFVEPHDNHLKKLLLTMLDPVIGVTIKTRHYHLKAYESCFVGKEAVDWYMANHRINSRSEVVTILDELREKGLIQHVVGDHCFKDEKLFYRFHINRAQIAAFGEAPPLVAIPLKDCLLKLERSGKCYEVIVYRPDFSPLIHDQQQPRQLDLPIEHEFHFRLPKKEYPAVQRWIFALEAAIVLGDAPESCTTPHDLLDSEEEDDDLVEEEQEEMEEEEEKEIIEEEEEEEKVIIEELSNAEKVVLQEMKAKLMKMQEQAEKVKEEDGNSSSMMDSDINYDELSDKQLLQYLRVKKLNVEEAITLLHRSIPYRKQHNLYNIQLTDVINEVGGKDGESGMLRLLEQARDKEGRRILLGFPKFYAPSRSPPLQVVRAIMYLLDIAMKDDELTQQEGFSVIVDGKGSKYSNFDPKMPRVMIEGIVSKYPARIGHVMLLHCPWFFKFIWAVVRPLLSQKLASKVHIMSSEKELLEYVEPCNLLPMHGGTFHHDQRAWIEARCTEENLPSPFSS